MSTPKVSIIVLVHDALRYVRECLNTLRQTTGVAHEIIVVDNASAWLATLLGHHVRGATSFGYVPHPPARADGYCFLIDKDLYLKYRLDEAFPWWWGLTKLQAQLLQDGWSVQAVDQHEAYIHHYGGKSKIPRDLATQSMEVDRTEIAAWFGSHQVRCIETA